MPPGCLPLLQLQDALLERWSNLRRALEWAPKVLSDDDAGEPESAALEAGSSGRPPDILGDSLRHELGQVVAALRRLKQGTYGVCTECGTPMAVDVLRSVPELAKCEQCRSPS